MTVEVCDIAQLVPAEDEVACAPALMIGTLQSALWDLSETLPNIRFNV